MGLAAYFRNGGFEFFRRQAYPVEMADDGMSSGCFQMDLKAGLTKAFAEWSKIIQRRLAAGDDDNAGRILQRFFHQAVHLFLRIASSGPAFLHIAPYATHITACQA